MTPADDKSPREWPVRIISWPTIQIMDEYDELAENGSALPRFGDETVLVEKSAYDALAAELAQARTQLVREQNEHTNAIVEIERLKREDNEWRRAAAYGIDLEAGLVTERDALSKRVLELEQQLQFTNSGWPYEKKLHERIERLREALELIKEDRPEGCYGEAQRIASGALEKDTNLSMK